MIHMNWIAQHHTYLTILLLSIFGLAVADWRYKLVIFRNAHAALKTWAVMLVFFLAWDVAGICLSVFSTNQSYVVGIHLITPDLPIEEVLFLTLLAYTSVWFYRIFELKGHRDA